MKFAIRLNFALCLALLVCVGCSSTGIGTRNKQLAKIQLSMSKTEVLAIMPDGVARGAKSYPNGTVEVLEYEAQDYAPFHVGADPWSGMIGQKTWLYFYNGKLVQGGIPGDWPRDPDKIIELRSR
jgi:hypothetical protein